MRGRGNCLTDFESAELERAYRNGASIDQLCERFDLDERAAYRRTEHIRNGSQRHDAWKTTSIAQLCLVGGCFEQVPRGRKFCDRHTPAPTANPALMGAR